MVRTLDVNIRDPYVLVHDGKYYLYGTRSATCWGPAEGFDCYVSGDMENWEGPIEIFHRPEGFFADRAYWAPECYELDGRFYLVTTLGSGDKKKGIYALRSASPTGPFEPYSERLTPETWTCIDGTLWMEDSGPVLVFSHSFEDGTGADISMVPLAADLSGPIGAPVRLFTPEAASWARPVPFAKAEFGMDGDVYFTDGPCLMRMENGRLYMTWSSWGTRGYAVGVAVSDSGQAAGPWRQEGGPLFPADGGHGMMFRDLAGQLRFVLHYPNEKYAERPVFYQLALEHGCLILQ